MIKTQADHVDERIVAVIEPALGIALASLQQSIAEILQEDATLLEWRGALDADGHRQLLLLSK